jgi:hypothetical protein
MWAAMERTDLPKKSIRYDAGFRTLAEADAGYGERSEKPRPNQCDVKAQ